jgi:hypothetical protein
MVSYKVKPEEAARNEKLVRAVYDELHRTRPDGIRYATFKLGDGVSFVHIASTDGDGPSPLSRLRAFQEFQDGIDTRCVEGPTVTDLQPIGAFEPDSRLDPTPGLRQGGR